MSDVKKVTLTVKIETACYTVAEVLRHAPAVIEAIEKAGPDERASGRGNIVKTITVNK